MHGIHLFIDGYGCASELLTSPMALESWLNALVSRIGMCILIPAAVKRIEPPDCKPKDWGVSGVCVITTSHIAVHTWPAQGKVWVDICSCKDFDVAIVLQEIVEAFGMGRWEHKIVERGGD